MRSLVTECPIGKPTLTIQNSRIQNSNILEIFRRGFKPRLKMIWRRSGSDSALPVEVGVLNPLISDNFAESYK